MSLVAERVPPAVNNMDVLNEYFGTFGPVVNLQINHARHEAIITFSRSEDATEALRWPVLNDPSVGLRPWRSKAGQRGPHEMPVIESSMPGTALHPAAGSTETPALAAAAVPAAVSAPAGATSAGTAPAASAGIAADPAQGKPALLATPSVPGTSMVSGVGGGGNMTLVRVSEKEGSAFQRRREKQEVEERRKKLLQGLTDQLKVVMGRISDPKTSEKNREQFQTILASIKDKITALTPKEPEPPKVPEPPPMRSWGAYKAYGASSRPHRPRMAVDDQDVATSETEAMETDIEEDELDDDMAPAETIISAALAAPACPSSVSAAAEITPAALVPLASAGPTADLSCEDTAKPAAVGTWAEVEELLPPEAGKEVLLPAKMTDEMGTSQSDGGVCASGIAPAVATSERAVSSDPSAVEPAALVVEPAAGVDLPIKEAAPQDTLPEAQPLILSDAPCEGTTGASADAKLLPTSVPMPIGESLAALDGTLAVHVSREAPIDSLEQKALAEVAALSSDASVVVMEVPATTAPSGPEPPITAEEVQPENLGNVGVAQATS